MDGLNNSLPPPPPLPTSSAPSPAPKHPLTKLNKISIGIVVVVLLFLGGYFITKKTTPTSPSPTPSITTPTTVIPSTQIILPTTATTSSVIPSPLPTGANPRPYATAPDDPNNLRVYCDATKHLAILSWDDVPRTDLYVVHVRGKTTEDVRVYTTSYTTQNIQGDWWIEAVNHNSDYSEAHSSKSVGGPKITCE